MRNTIKSKSDIEDLFGNGRRFKSKGVIIIVAPTKEGRGQLGRVAFVAGKKLGSAPKRNYAKRVMRQICSEIGGSWPGLDVVFMARNPLFDMDYRLLREDCRSMVERALTELA